jgi:hypothetical protein
MESFLNLTETLTPVATHTHTHTHITTYIPKALLTEDDGCGMVHPGLFLVISSMEVPQQNWVRIYISSGALRAIP